jgi:hypothetical protein
MIKHKKMMSDMNKNNDETSDEDEIILNETQRAMRDNLRRSANPNLINTKKTSLYESDNNTNMYSETQGGQSNNQLPNFKKLLLEKNQLEEGMKMKKIKNTGPSFKGGKLGAKEDALTHYKYV